MKPFLTSDEEAMLVEAIREQELRTSAEIRVCLSYRWIFRPERFAWKKFDEIGMRQTQSRNGALIVVLPSVKQVVVIGDTGFDAVVGPEFWKEAVDAMVRQMHADGPLAALREGLARLGDTLARHWPREGDDANELADEIVRG